MSVSGAPEHGNGMSVAGIAPHADLINVPGATLLSTDLAGQSAEVEVIFYVVFIHLTEEFVASQATEPTDPAGLVGIGAGHILAVFAVRLGHQVDRVNLQAMAGWGRSLILHLRRVVLAAALLQVVQRAAWSWWQGTALQGCHS